MFAIPKIKAKKTSSLLPVSDITKFKWEDVAEKEEIGRGSFGAVYRTKFNNVPVVVKKLHERDEESMKEFIKEVKLLESLQHENIVKLKAICTNPNAMMLEFVNFDFRLFGDETQVNNLSDFLTHVDETNDCKGFVHLMPVIAEDIAKGLNYLHGIDIVHRDMKTANVLVSNQHYNALEDEEKFCIEWIKKPITCKLSDFGESRSREIQTRTLVCTKTANVDRGTPAYMAPETILYSDVSKEATIEDLKKIDVWSYGMVLFKICNPHIRYPYHLDVKDRKDKLRAMRTLIKEGRRPTRDSKYESLHSNEWKILLELYSNCTMFNGTDRPYIHEIVERFGLDHRETSNNHSPKRYYTKQNTSKYFMATMQGRNYWVGGGGGGWGEV